MDYAVAVERVVLADRRLDLVVAVVQVATVQVLGNIVDHLQVGCASGLLSVGGQPVRRHVWVIRGRTGQCTFAIELKQSFFLVRQIKRTIEF